MRFSSISQYFISKPLRMKVLFLFLFILYGAFISLISYYILESNHFEDTKKELINIQKQDFKIKSSMLKMKLEVFENEIVTLKNNWIFKNFLKDFKKDEIIINVFSMAILRNKEISQLRFIDFKGNEKIRIERKEISSRPIIMEDKKLQNKVSRYYFKDIKNTKKDTIWYSKLDLNMEHGKIEKPIVPTLRLGTPIYENGKFKGIIIMNIFFKKIIEDFVNTPFSYLSIYDKNGEFIYNYIDENGLKIDNSWSKYLKKDYNLKKYKSYLKNILDDEDLKGYILKKDISNIIPNSDKLSIFYEPKLEKVKKIEENSRAYVYALILSILILSIPLAFIISIIPNILNNELYKTKRKLEDEIQVVNEYVSLFIADVNGYIRDVSSAFEKLTGYSKQELIGRKSNILKQIDLKNSKKLLNIELDRVRKDGTTFNARVFIKETKKKLYTVYIEDITYEKKIEKLSVTDELTKLYNRREFNKVFKRSIAYSKRYSFPFSMMMVDIDYFKEYNDTYGHQKGDDILQIVANEILNIAFRLTDVAFRLGGEEFALIFSSHNLENVKLYTEKLRHNIENLKIEHSNSKVSKYLTVSIGLFYADKILDLNEEVIYKYCDDALYEAKKKGRNQVSLISK